VKFWDSSALVPLLVSQPSSEAVLPLLEEDRDMVTWWASRVEVASATSRLLRDGQLTPAAGRAVRESLETLCDSAAEIEPHESLRERALRLLATHPLRAADALQLAAALVWCQERPKGCGFVCLDERLGEAARREGFEVYPA
jgi:predicted nucleic acid-binding protein